LKQFNTISLDGIYTLSKAYLARGGSLPAPMNSKAKHSGASLAAGRATHGGQISGKVSDKDRHADPSGSGDGRWTIIDCLQTLTMEKPLPENRPNCHRKKSRRRPDNLCGMKQFCAVVFSTDFHTLRVYLKAN